MAEQTVTLTIPDDLYRRFQQHAAFKRHSIEEELLSLATAALVEDEIPADMLEAVAALVQLDDATLREVAHNSAMTENSLPQAAPLERQRLGGLLVLGFSPIHDVWHIVMIYFRYGDTKVIALRARRHPRPGNDQGAVWL
jgi:plasmid stability protein